jgi:3-hydroxy-9,10-secoandrosta-1,3,5(10)-triene-9,17-dione monooxygenase reductase component
VSIEFGNPFATPPGRREPARRLRGRLAAPVTVWTSGHPGAGLTVSSVLVAEGDPPRLLGLLDPVTRLSETIAETGTFVVHVLGEDDQRLGERFAENRPPIRGQFEGLTVTPSAWGPVLAGTRPLASCRLAAIHPMGRAELVEGVIEEITLPVAAGPLVWYHGGWRTLG